MNKLKSQAGFSLVEAILATSVFGLAITGLAGSLIIGQQASLNAGARVRATDLAIEGIETVRNIRDEAFNELQFNQSGVDNSTNEWVFSGEGTTETIDVFTRTISFSDVCRDGNDEIAACPADYTDPHTKEVTSTVEWAPRPGSTDTVSRTTYLTNWETNIWTQTDWSGGGGQAEWSDTTQYDSDDTGVDGSTSGQLQLAGGGGSNLFFTDDEQSEFDSGSHSDTEYDVGNSALELTAAGITAGTGTFTSRIFDSGNANTAWDDISWLEDLGPRGELRMEAGTTTVGNSFSTVTLAQSYDNPVVIPIYFESANTEPVSVRLQNITSSSFEIRLQRPDGGTASSDTVHYLVVEEGAHALPDGTLLEAHQHTTSTIGYKNNWNSDSISYTHTYSSAPAVFHQVQTYNDSGWIESWVGSPSSISNPPTTSGFNLGLNGAEAVTSHGSETIGWLAIETGTGTLNGTNYEVAITGDTVEGHSNECENQTFSNSYSANPIAIADQQEMDGGDGSWAVMCALSTTAIGVHAEEDTVGDTERTHTSETFAFMAWEQAFSFSALDLTIQVRSCDDAACSGEAFVGPDGTAGTVFTTPGGEALDLIDNQYVQYQVTLTTADNVFTPQLLEITIAGTIPTEPWWDTNYGYRKKITFGTSHSILPEYFTANLTMDTQEASTNVELSSGDDIRVVWQPTVGSPVELDRIGDTWDNASTQIDFRLQSEIGANLAEDTDGSYYVYYGYASAGTPPMDEGGVYYFADFFNRADSSTIGNGWTEWTTGGGNVSISSNAATVAGNNTGPADAGIKQNFGLGTISGDFVLEFDWTMPTNPEGIWTHYVNIGNGMDDNSRTTGVGPGIYNGEGAHFSPNGTENVSNDLSGNMENSVNGGPHLIRMEVDATNFDYDYYRDGSLIAANQNWVNSGTAINQIRIATDQYVNSATPFGYDNLKVYLKVADDADEVGGSEESQGGAAGQIVDDSQTEFDSGSYSATQYDSGNSWLELTAGGQTAGTGTYTSDIFDAGSSASWDNLAWLPQRPTGKELPAGSGSNWWNTNYGFRQKITFGTAHSILPEYYTASIDMDTQTSSTNVELSSGDDVRIVWQPAVGSAVELDRIGTTWNNASTQIDFRLQSEIGANLDEDVDGSYYVYYGYASAGTPPTNENNVYYFADFFDRADSSTIGNGWTEWNGGSSDVSIAGNAITVKGHTSNYNGIKQSFPLGAITGNFTLAFDWTMPSNGDSTWKHYVNIGNSSSMSDTNETSGVGPGIYNGEGSDFIPNGTENISNDLSGNMENTINGGPQAIRIVVDTSGQTYDYYRADILRASGQTYVTAQSTLNQIRIASRQYFQNDPVFTYDNLKIFLNVADDPEGAFGSEETPATTTETGYAAGNVDMSSNALLLHLNESVGSTTFVDDSGLGNDATCTGGTCPTAGASGRLNTGLDFDGTDDFIAVPSSSQLETDTNLTAAAWVNIDSITSLDHNPILWKGTQIGWGANYTFRIAVNSGGSMTWGVSYGSTEDWFAAGSVGLGEWHHVALTYDGDIARAYIDGVEVGDSGGGGSSLNTFSSSPVRSGLAYRSTPTEETYLDGTVDEIGIWGRTLSGADIEDLYRRGALRLTYQVRSCDDLACSGESFVGPDGTAGTYYSELDNSTLTTPTFAITNLSDNQYFQYQTTFNTIDSTISPEVLSVTVDYTASGGGGGSGYSLSGSLLSSAFNMGNVSPVQIIEWDEVIPTCSPTCSIQFQVRTAPDASGSPGTWTNWYGQAGVGTYFTNDQGTRISVDLNGNQWVQYRVELAGDGLETPILEEVRTYYR